LLTSWVTVWLNAAIVVGVFIAFALLGGSDRVAVLALGLSVLAALYEPRRRAEARKAFNELLAEAVYEACHNLQHLASWRDAASWEKDDRQKWPEFYVRAASRLLEPPYAEYTLKLPKIMELLDHMIRNDDFIRRYAPTAENLTMIKNSVGYFIEQCIRLVIRAGRSGEESTGPEVRAVIAAVGQSYLTRIAIEDNDEFWVRLTRERAELDIEKAKRQRAEGRPSVYDLSGQEVPYYWFGDPITAGGKPQEPLHDVFGQLSDPPPRPPVTPLVVEDLGRT
jgi:hypothetical protein